MPSTVLYAKEVTRCATHLPSGMDGERSRLNYILYFRSDGNLNLLLFIQGENGREEKLMDDLD